MSGQELASATAGMLALPSTSRTPDGAPRFTVHVPIASLADPRRLDAYRAERLGAGAEASLRAFVADELRAGDALVDLDAGWGLVTLTAATLARGVHVVAVATPEDAPVLEGAERAAGDAPAIVAHESPATASVAALLVRHAPGARRVFVRVGDPETLARVIDALTPLRADGRLAALLLPDAGVTAASVLAAHDLVPLALGRDADGEALLPLALVPEARDVIALAPAFLEAQGVEAPVIDAAPREGPRPLGICWSLGATSGWGIYGMNLALRALERGDVAPVCFAPPVLDGLDAARREALAPALATHADVQAGLAPLRGGSASASLCALYGLGNGFDVPAMDPMVVADRRVAVVFFEDTTFGERERARLAPFHRVIAGSSWNARRLREAGVADVRTVIQGIDPTVFHPAPRRGRFAGRFVVFSGGKLEFRKGQDLVVAAFRAFQQRHPEALLLTAWHNHWPVTMEEVPLAGHVRGVPTVRADRSLDVAGWLAGNGLPREAVHDVGLLPNALMGDVVREADVALFANRCEGGTNLVAMECMAAGVPVILSANTGHLDLVDDAHCYALRAQGAPPASRGFRAQEDWGESSVEEMVEQLERAYADREDAARRAAAGAAFMRDYGWSQSIDRLIAAVDDLL